jgi:hypothetical protein
MAGVVAVLAAAAPAAFAQTTQQNLLDRVQIEDLLVNYYSVFGGANEDISQYFAEDGVLDINGRIFQGKGNVQKAYGNAGATPLARGKFHMLMSNPRIVVTGDTATADLIWTGIMSDNVKAPPRFIEQGREHDEFAKVGGRWLLKKRVITSDGGLPDSYDKTYRDR